MADLIVKHRDMYLVVPDGTDWPVEEREADSGDILLDPEFFKILAEASGLQLDQLTDEMVGAVLQTWYQQRLAQGHPADPLMDELMGLEFEDEPIFEWVGEAPDEEEDDEDEETDIPGGDGSRG